MKNTIQHRAVKPFVFPLPNSTIGVVIKVGKDTVNKIELVYGDPMGGWSANSWDHWSEQMDKKATGSYHDIYEAKISMNTKRWRYAFKIFPKIGEPFIFGESGVIDLDDIKVYAKGFTYSYWNKIDFLNTPSWFRETSWYQIFPDRFAKTELEMKSDNHWNEIPKEHEFYGGNIKGIIEKLDHIKNLGFNGLYLTPIFDAKTSHRYETNDYNKIDPMLGSEEDFKKLVKEAHKRGMKIMLDAVFNHIGYHSNQFQDVIKNKEESKYKDWFWINDFKRLKQPKEYSTGEFAKYYPYETFAMVPEMPRINWHNNDASEYLIKAAEKWTKMGIDGWRLDVSFEPPIKFWREFNSRVKGINNEVVIIGEVWWDSLQFLEQDIWHGIMNYPVREAIMDFVKSDDTYKDKLKFIERFNDLSYTYTPEQQWGMFNLISSHDVERFYTTINKDDHKFKLAMQLCFMQPGAPSTYYGQEIGMEGKFDPDNRRTYPWDKNETKFFEFFKKLNMDRNIFVNTSNIFDRFVGKLEGKKVILENKTNIIEIENMNFSWKVK